MCGVISISSSRLSIFAEVEHKVADLLSISELEKAISTLQEAIAFADSSQMNEKVFKIARDASIQRFEYCIELAWKTSMKKLGSQTKFPKPAVREMARGNLIDSAEVWLEFIDARNETSHSYDEKVAERVFKNIRKFSDEAVMLFDRLKNLA